VGLWGFKKNLEGLKMGKTFQEYKKKIVAGVVVAGGAIQAQAAIVAPTLDTADALIVGGAVLAGGAAMWGIKKAISMLRG